MKACQELYALRVVEYGEENEYTIYAGITYAIYLRKTNRGSSEELGDPNHGLHHKGLGGGRQWNVDKVACSLHANTWFSPQLHQEY